MFAYIRKSFGSRCEWPVLVRRHRKWTGREVMAEVVDYERLEPIPASYACAGIVLSIAFFQTLNQTVLRGGCPKAVGRENYWKWRNLVVSWMHALIVGVWDISWYAAVRSFRSCREASEFVTRQNSG